VAARGGASPSSRGSGRRGRSPWSAASLAEGPHRPNESGRLSFLTERKGSESWNRAPLSWSPSLPLHVPLLHIVGVALFAAPTAALAVLQRPVVGLTGAKATPEERRVRVLAEALALVDLVINLGPALELEDYEDYEDDGDEGAGYNPNYQGRVLRLVVVVVVVVVVAAAAATSATSAASAAATTSNVVDAVHVVLVDVVVDIVDVRADAAVADAVRVLRGWVHHRVGHPRGRRRLPDLRGREARGPRARAGRRGLPSRAAETKVLGLGGGPSRSASASRSRRGTRIVLTHLVRARSVLDWGRVAAVERDSGGREEPALQETLPAVVPLVPPLLDSPALVRWLVVGWVV
jgi:hypothetical protein